MAHVRSTNNSIHGKAKWSTNSVVRHKLKVAMQFGARKWMDFTYSECCYLSIDEAFLAREQCAQLNVEVLPKILLHVNFNMNILNGITTHCHRFEFHALDSHTHVQFVRIAVRNKGECVCALSRQDRHAFNWMLSTIQIKFSMEIRWTKYSWKFQYLFVLVK